MCVCTWPCGCQPARSAGRESPQSWRTTQTRPHKQPCYSRCHSPETAKPTGRQQARRSQQHRCNRGRRTKRGHGHPAAPRRAARDMARGVAVSVRQRGAVAGACYAIAKLELCGGGRATVAVHLAARVCAARLGDALAGELCSGLPAAHTDQQGCCGAPMLPQPNQVANMRIQAPMALVAGLEGQPAERAHLDQHLHAIMALGGHLRGGRARGAGSAGAMRRAWEAYGVGVRAAGGAMDAPQPRLPRTPVHGRRPAGACLAYAPCRWRPCRHARRASPQVISPGW